MLNKLSSAYQTDRIKVSTLRPKILRQTVWRNQKSHSRSHHCYQNTNYKIKMVIFLQTCCAALVPAGAYLTLSLVGNIPRRSRKKFFCSHVKENVHKSNQVFTWWTWCSPGEHRNIFLKTVLYLSITSFFTIFPPEFRKLLFHRFFSD